MSCITSIFDNIEKLTHEGGHQEFLSALKEMDSSFFISLKTFLDKIVKEIDNLSNHILGDETILISVKNQKLLRTSYQLITTLGISQCLIPGVGLSLSKRSLSASALPSFKFSQEQKYEMLTQYTDFFTRTYKIPVLKKIILTLHLSDYLAALIQLSFAPLKKPGEYVNFTMTPQAYAKLYEDQQMYKQIYEDLVENTFQPILMKELLVLQSVRDPDPPKFLKRVIANEMSQRLLVSGGLLNLIRCFMDSCEVDTGFDWKKVDMIRKIVSCKHGTGTETSYLNNICSQLSQILTLNNTHYLTTSISCILSIYDKYSQAEPVKDLVKDIFQTFDYDYLTSKSNLPGTIILSPQDVELKVKILNACMSTSKHDFPISLLISNIYVLFLLGMHCSEHEELKTKLNSILTKCFENCDKIEMTYLIKDCLFGKKDLNLFNMIEEYDAGLAIKCTTTKVQYPIDKALIYLLDLIKLSSDNNFVQNVFDISLNMLIEFDSTRTNTKKKETLMDSHDVPDVINEIVQQYGYILQLLSELATSPKIMSCIKTDPSTVISIVEYFIMNSESNKNEECVTISLVLLNTILSDISRKDNLENKFVDLIPVLKKLSNNEASINHILCKEALTLITSENIKQEETEFKRAITDMFDDLLPVRAHGIIALTKLIDKKDTETISKKHYIFCLFQEHLKDPDSYMYLSAINGIAALGAYCPEDVLHVLCKEFLQMSINENDFETKLSQDKQAELRMKIGDVIVKVTKKLGEMAVVHKTVLLNTILCGCRDEDPLIRTSALSNLAEIALVLNYKIGSIIYEVLLCIWSILESDKAIECRRAAVMVIASLIKGLGRDVLIELKDNILPIYRTLKEVYSDNDEDSVLRLHAQIALEELNDVVKQFVFPELHLDKKIFVLDNPNIILK